MDGIEWLIAFLGAVFGICAFLLLFCSGALEAAGRVGVVGSAPALTMIASLYAFMRTVSPGAGKQKVMVKINVPQGTPKVVLPLFFEDDDRVIFKFLVKHGKLNMRKLTITYEGGFVYDGGRNQFDINGRHYTPQLLEVVEYGVS